MQKISVIVPVHNEESYIVNNLEIIRNVLVSLKYEYEILVVDDCSSDDTNLILNHLKMKDVKILHKPVNQGKGSAIKTGCKFAIGDLCMVIDADLQIDPIEIKTFINIMDLYNADVVIGNKRHIYSNSAYSFSRKVVSIGYYLLIKALFGFPLRDTQCGLKLFKKHCLDLVLSKVLVKQYAFDLEVLVALHTNHFRIADAPVYVKPQVNGGSVKLGTIIQTFYDTLAVWYRRRKGWYKV